MNFQERVPTVKYRTEVPPVRRLRFQDGQADFVEEVDPEADSEPKTQEQGILSN